MLERHRGYRTAHAALLTTSLDVLAGDAPAPPLLNPLSEAEVRVVRYLPSNLKAPEIAAELFVSSTPSAPTCATSTRSSAPTRAGRPCAAPGLGLLAPSARGR